MQRLKQEVDFIGSIVVVEVEVVVAAVMWEQVQKLLSVTGGHWMTNGRRISSTQSLSHI